MNIRNSASKRTATRASGYHVASLLSSGLLMAAGLVLAGAAQAQTASAPAASDSSLTYHGITLYGIIDIGLQAETHGAPYSDYFPAGGDDLLQKNSAGSVTGVTPNNMSQSRIGIQGSEPIAGDWTGVFRVETYFNPQSGDFSDGLKSLTLNAGKSAANQTTGVDTSVAGELFQQAYAGFSSPTIGTLTFGRQNTILADGIAKYDPQGASQAFSVIGFSGTTAGGGDTQDRRLDNSFKYVLNFAGFHAGGMYKLNGTNGSANTALELQLGANFAGLSVDAYYTSVRDAVSVSALSAAQLNGNPAAVPPVPSLAQLGYSPTNALSGTISDNTAYAFMGMYNLGDWKFYGGYERIQYANPSAPLAAGFNDIGGYVLAYVNNAAFPNQKVLQVYWGGAKVTVMSDLDLTAAVYAYKQNSYAAGADALCSSNISGACSGTLTAWSVSADYRITKRLDTYIGVMYSEVAGGLSNGYLNTNTADPTIGVRYKF
ncbi:MAG TPA: porin [Steroidobacteraceae bacterium]